MTEEEEWEILDGLLDRAENGGPCWYLDGRLVVERGEVTPYVNHYGEEMVDVEFDVAHFYAKALNIFVPRWAPPFAPAKRRGD